VYPRFNSDETTKTVRRSSLVPLSNDAAAPPTVSATADLSAAIVVASLTTNSTVVPACEAS